MSVLKHANQKAGNDVDGGNEDRGQRVALAETRGAVHGAVEFRFAGDLFAAGAGSALVNHSGVQVGVDGHLLAGQRIESETRGHFRRAHRAVVDHQVLNGDQREEHHETDDVVASHHELAEGFDHVAGRSRAFIAVEQNAPRAGQIERQPEQRKQQEQSGKNGKLHGTKNLQRGRAAPDTAR